MKWERVYQGKNSISLSISYRVYADLYEDGRIRLETSTGASHGDPGGSLGPVPFGELIDLLNEARAHAVARWGEGWGA